MAPILVTDDDPDTRNIVAQILESNGYSVLTAEDGVQALGIIENQYQQLDLLLTDLIMPGLDGWGLARRAVALRPRMKVIVMSGQDHENVERGMRIRRSGVAFLQKPFTNRALVHQVRGMLPL